MYHVLNRSVGKMHLFRKDASFEAFQQVIIEAHQRHPIRILSFCLMPSHWHFVVWPQKDGQLTAFLRWLTHTHAVRWRTSHHTIGYGHLYQDRFKSFVVKRDRHLLTLCRYVERNALAAGLVERAQDWRYGSLWARHANMSSASSSSSPSSTAASTTSSPQGHPIGALLTDWPAERPANWIELVNRPLTEKELERVRVSLSRGRPFGPDDWTRRTASRLNLQHTLRGEGRPKKKAEKN